MVDHSTEGVKEGIRKLRDNRKLCETLGRRALGKALKEFNWDIEAGKLMEVHENL